MAKKISKNSKKYQQNIAKQKYLNKHGIKVEIGGPWGSWQEEQYNKIKSQEVTFNTNIIADVGNLLNIVLLLVDLILILMFCVETIIGLGK